MDTLVERVQREGTPLIDGDTATFVWGGDHPVRLTADFNGWGAQPAEMTQHEPGIWTYTTTLPRNAYLEYAYFDGDQRMSDPCNKRRASTGFGPSNNYFTMPDMELTPLVRGKRGMHHGTLRKHLIYSDYLLAGGKRAVYLYQPPTEAPCPLLVVWDGREYLHRARLIHIVDNLVAQGRMQPLALAMVEHGRQARFLEYACSEATIGLLMSKVLPLAREHLNLLDVDRHPGAFGVAGASMGGLMALYTSMRLPDIFGKVISQSGAFALQMMQREVVLDELIRHGPVRPIDIYMGVGTMEWLLAANRRMHALLRERGYAVTYREFCAGHNYTAWRNDIWRGLERLYGGVISPG